MPTFISVLTTGPFTLPASPSGANAIEIIMQAAGAGGGGNTGSGGGSGEYMRRTFPIGPGVAYSGTVGAAGTSSASVGTAGGDTTFSDGTTTYTVKGGLPGNTTSAGGQAGGRLGPVGGAYPGSRGLAIQVSKRSSKASIPSPVHLGVAQASAALTTQEVLVAAVKRI